MELKCDHCEKDLQPLNPPVEDYLTHKFCVKIFGWKLMLLKDHIEMGCSGCIIDEKQTERRDEFMDAVSNAIADEIEKGNLIPRR